MDRQLKLTDTAIIDLLGGTAKVAKMCKLDPAAVSNWRVRGIPADKYMFLGARIEEVSHGLVTRQDLFPNNYFLIWPELLKHNAFGLQKDIDEE
jgi:DNA-binding transcriptional regulator YdaS (Cro superfamily)